MVALAGTVSYGYAITGDNRKGAWPEDEKRKLGLIGGHDTYSPLPASLQDSIASLSSRMRVCVMVSAERSAGRADVPAQRQIPQRRLGGRFAPHVEELQRPHCNRP